MKYYPTSPTLQIERVMSEHRFHFNKYLEAMNKEDKQLLKFHSLQSQLAAVRLDRLVAQLKENEK